MSQNLLPDGLALLLDTYDQSLAEVAFPGVSAQVLHDKVTALEALRAQARTLEAELATLTRTLLDEEKAAAELFERALDYAKVYAKDTPELSATLAKVKLPKSDKRGAPRPKKKPKVVRSEARPAKPKAPEAKPKPAPMQSAA